MDIPLIRDLGLGFTALCLGVVSVINGKDKTNKTDCTACRKEIDGRLVNGDKAFAHIEEQLKPISFIEARQRKMEMTLVAIATKMRIPTEEDK